MIPLFALFAAAFAIGTSEFVIAGILPSVADDLAISIPTAGYLVSIYALGVAVGGPVLATFTGRFPRKRLLLVYVGIFALGYVACALAPNFVALLSARAAVALIHGAYFGTAIVLATNLVPETRRGFALSLVLAGLTVANVVGVPLGTAIGTAFGWRMTFWAVAAMGAVSFLAIWALVPADSAHEAQRSNVAAEVRVLGREPVWTSLAVIVTQTIGQFALFTYISPVLTGPAGVDAGTVPWLLLLFGVGATVGMLLGGRLSDWRLMFSLVAMLLVQVASLLLMAIFIHQTWIVAVLLIVWGATTFGFAAPAQARILGNTRDAPTLAANLIPSAFNVAIAFGAWVGGSLIDAGGDYANLPWIALAAAVVASAIAIISWRRAGRLA